MYFTSFGCFSSNFHDVMWLTYVLKCIESDNLLFFWQSIREWLKLPFLVISKNSHWKLHMICINSDITKCCGTPWLSSVGIWLIRHLRPVTTHLVLLRTHCSRTPGNTERCRFSEEGFLSGHAWWKLVRMAPSLTNPSKSCPDRCTKVYHCQICSDDWI